MAKKQKNIYFDEEGFQKAFLEWIALHGKDPQHLPEKLGLEIYNLAKHMTEMRSFISLPQDVKDEMVSFSTYNMLKTGLRTYDPTKGRAFSYFTRAVYTKFLTVLNKMKKEASNYQKIAQHCKDQWLLETQLQFPSLQASRQIDAEGNLQAGRQVN